MPAPAKNFTVIADTDVDPDSPITTGLMTALRDNDLHLEEWVGMSYTAAQDHNHDGANSSIVALTGASINRASWWEIYDHFLDGAIHPNGVWAETGSPTYAATPGADHYVSLGASDRITSLTTYRIESVRSVLEMRCKLTPTTTDWSACNIGSRGSSRHAVFIDAAGADGVRCQTVGSGGTQNTDITIGGNGVDDWHVYKIDLANGATNVKFCVDGTLVATHATAVPDAQDQNVVLEGTVTNELKVDYVKFYFIDEVTNSTA